MEDRMEFTNKAVIETSMGKITVGLYGKEMPVTVANFIKHIEAKYYNKLIFHRVIDNFMIQGGGMMKSMFEKVAMVDPIKLETCSDIPHKKYTISMARTDVPNSATSQFFICNTDCDFLDGKYAAFGTVIEGMDVVDAISKVETHSVRSYDDVPVEPVVINDVYMI